MKNILQQLFEHQTLTKQDAKAVMMGIAEGKYKQEHIVAFLTVYQLRNITVDELAGFREALLELCIPVKLHTSETIDVCGTGGDGKNTFNISTLSAFVLAGAGAKVAKHGNYGVSSVSGSSNVLENLGITFTNNIDQLNEQLGQTNICFLHAPLFHPALKQVGSIRKELGFKTFFNILGPLVNPAKPAKQYTGVYNLELARLYSYLLQNSNTDYAIVHSLDVYDEVSLTAPFKLISKSAEKVLSPEDIGLSSISAESIFGGNTVSEAAEIFLNVLHNKASKEQRDVVLANSALALACAKNTSINEALKLCRESLQSGKALEKFNLLKSLN